MIKGKHLIVVIISFLLLSLMACNAGNNALDTENYYQNDQSMINNNSGFNTDTISSESTTISSNKYPHTKAIQIQEAKYEFVVQHGKGQGKFKLPKKIAPGLIKQYQKEAVQPPTQREAVPQQQPSPNEGEAAPQQQPSPNQGEAVPQQQPSPNQGEVAPPQQPAPKQEEAAPTPKADTQTESAQGISEIEAKVIELTNVERRNNGLSDLQADTSLSNVARTKSNDMQENNYFSHTSPTYGSPFDMIRDFGISYNSAAENIAQGQRTAEQVVQAWMNSEGHRKNILNGDFTHIGVGYNSSGHHWTQMFISK